MQRPNSSAFIVNYLADEKGRVKWSFLRATLIHKVTTSNLRFEVEKRKKLIVVKRMCSPLI